MSAETRTNSVLLLALKDPADQEAWSEFDQRYRPVVVGFARRFGLQEAEAEDVGQETMLRVVRDFRSGQFDHERGRLRAWLYAIARSRVVDARRRDARHRADRGESALAEHADDATVSKLFEEEWQRELLRAAIAELRATTHADPQTLRAFELLVVDERGAAEVSKELGMNVNAVYVAKHRTLARLRTIVERLQEEF